MRFLVLNMPIAGLEGIGYRRSRCEGSGPKVKVILDTNVLISDVFFAGSLLRMLQAWRAGLLHPHAPGMACWLAAIGNLSANNRCVPTWGENPSRGLRKTRRVGETISGITTTPCFDSRTLDNITTFDLEKLKGELKKSVTDRGTPCAAQTIKHILVIVRRHFNLARKWGLHVGEKPISKVEMPHAANQVTEHMTDEELSRLPAVLDNWPFNDCAAFIKLAMFTCMRRGELFKIQWNPVDFGRGMLTLTDLKGQKTEVRAIA